MTMRQDDVLRSGELRAARSSGSRWNSAASRNQLAAETVRAFALVNQALKVRNGMRGLPWDCPPTNAPTRPRSPSSRRQVRLPYYRHGIFGAIWPGRSDGLWPAQPYLGMHLEPADEEAASLLRQRDKFRGGRCSSGRG